MMTIDKALEVLEKMKGEGYGGFEGAQALGLGIEVIKVKIKGIKVQSPEVEALAEVIEGFLAQDEGEDDRQWSSVGMAKAIIDAGYSKK